MKTIKIKIPATTANFGSGFDVLGAALKLYNEIEVSEVGSRKSEVEITIEGEGKDTLPENEKNAVVRSMNAVFKICKKSPPVYRLRLINRIPLARGLGSSAAARLGGIVAANEICGKKLSDDEVIQIVSKLEGHPDNVVPSFFGGLCICNFNEKNVKYAKLKMPSDLKAVLCIPGFELSTDKARNNLPKIIHHKDAVFNSGRVALFMSAIIQKKYELLSIAMEDKLHQPYRKKFIPGMEDVFNSAKKSGAYGVCISGSGPTIIALAGGVKGENIGRAMQKAFLRHNVESKNLVCDFDNYGIKKYG